MTIRNFNSLPRLPISHCIDALLAALEQDNAAILLAPPGAGKTSRIPLALLDQPWIKNKKILVLEPRRLAARSAAIHMAELLGEQVGITVGYKIKFETLISENTRIEFMTEGVFNRMILDDPELEGIGAVIFDEYHERNLEGDLGLVFALESQAAFRPDLRILPMSATIDGVKVSKIMAGAPLIESKGRSFPLKITYAPKAVNESLELAFARVIMKSLKEDNGSILCFLPGLAEIKRLTRQLNTLPAGTHLFQLFGALDQKEQIKAIMPSPKGERKIVLATSIAETSITIDGISVVIDSGLSRIAKFNPATGVSELKTIKASMASITQRAGRAGRTSAGTVIRLWHEGQNNSLPEYNKPEILDCDLAPVLLNLARWGISNPEDVNWLDKPPKAAWMHGRDLLQQLNAIDDQGKLTSKGKIIGKLPFPPRLGKMILCATGGVHLKQAIKLAILVGERGLGGNDIDIAKRLSQLNSERSPKAEKIAKTVKKIALQLDTSSNVSNKAPYSIGGVLSIAYFDRIARNMGQNEEGDFIFKLANGRRVKLEALSSLSKHEYLVVCDFQGSAAYARITAAAEITKSEIIQLHSANISANRQIEFDKKNKKYKVFETRSLGALLLEKHYKPVSESDNISELVLEKIKADGLSVLTFSKQTEQLLSQLRFLKLHNQGPYKNTDENALLANLEEWLLPFIPDITSIQDITPTKLHQGLSFWIGFEALKNIELQAPCDFLLPSGIAHRLVYENEQVILRAKVQEFFGMKAHPTLLQSKIPITFELLSPALRPLQSTNDIVGFWNGSWNDVKKEMRGRYPKHFWPDDPQNAIATSKTKPRKQCR